MRQDNKDEVITIRVDSVTLRELDSLSRKLRSSRTRLIRDAIDKYLLEVEFDVLSDEFTGKARQEGYIEERDFLEEIS